MINDKIKIESLPKVKRWCDKINDLNQKRVNIGEVKLYVEEQAGEDSGGYSLLLINGGPGGTHHDFHPQFNHLKSMVSRIIYYDQRGCGQSDYNSGNKKYSFYQAVDDIDRLRRRLKIKKWVVLGYSYGGHLAQYYAVKFPRQVAGMILVNASPGFGDGYLGDRQEERKTRKEREMIDQIRNVAEMDEVIKLYNLFLAGDWKRQYYKKPDRIDLTRDMKFGWDHDRRLREEIFQREWPILTGAFKFCPIPTLIVEGKNDLTWGEGKDQALLENHPGAQLVTIDRAAHVVWRDRPEIFFRELKKFLSLIDSTKIDIRKWQKYLDKWKTRKEKRRLDEEKKTQEYFRRNYRQLSQENIDWKWSDEIDIWRLLELMKANFMMKKYSRCCRILKSMADYHGKKEIEFLIDVWSGIIFDCLGNRMSAKRSFQEALGLEFTGTIVVDEFDLVLSNKQVIKYLNNGFKISGDN